jgi:hypothetical protein
MSHAGDDPHAIPAPRKGIHKEPKTRYDNVEVIVPLFRFLMPFRRSLRLMRAPALVVALVASAAMLTALSVASPARAGDCIGCLVQEVSGKVGIGTTGPGFPLHVYTAAQVGEARIQGNAYAKVSFKATSGGSDQKAWQFYEDSVANAFLLSALNDAENTASTAVQFNRGSGTTISSVIFPNGNVGIGTTTPLGGLDVEATDSWAAINRAYGYLNSSGASTSSGYSPSTPVAIYTSGRIVAQEIDGFSDARKKQDISGIDSKAAAEFIAKVRPVKFHWKDKPGDKESFGFIAQDISKIGFDNLVGTEIDPKLHKVVDQDGFVSPEGVGLSLDYNGVIPLLTKAVQDLKADNDNLRARIDVLEAARQ